LAQPFDSQHTLIRFAAHPSVMSESDEDAPMLENGEIWDAQELSEIIEHIPFENEGRISYALEKAEIVEGCCHPVTNFCSPWRWVDFEAEVHSIHLAVSANNVMYLRQKFPKHVLNTCPPCMCCVVGNYRSDYDPKIRKLIPLEKITDIEVHEAGSNELVTPGCMCPPECNPRSVEVPVSKTMINTAGGLGPELIIEGIEDANGFRRRIMTMKQGGAMPAPKQMGMAMPASPATLGASTEMVNLLRDIASSNKEIVNVLRAKQ